MHIHLTTFRRLPGETMKTYILSLLPTSEQVWWIVILCAFAGFLALSFRT